MKSFLFLVLFYSSLAGAFTKSSDLRLHTAAADGDLAKVEKLLKSGVSANLLDDNKYPALYFAFDNDSEDIALALLQKMDLSVKVGTQKESLLISAIRKNQLRSVQFLLLKNPSLLKENAAENMSPLMIAARFSTPQIAQALLDAGAKPTEKNKFGANALEMANKAQNNAVVEVLTKAQEQIEKKK